MRAVVAVLCAVAVSGCWDFQAARTKCQGSGACERSSDGGSGEVGLMPPFVVAVPSQAADAAVVTSTGFRWEYPYPGGPMLRHLAVVSDQELWATGEGDTVLHLQHGQEPHFRRLPPGSSGLRSAGGARIVAQPDGSVLAAGEGSLQQWTGREWISLEDWDFSPSVAVVGPDGTPWIGGSAGSSGPCGEGRAVVREGVSPTTEHCLSRSTARVAALDPFGWALDTTGALSERSSGGWVGVPSPGTAIEPEYGAVLALSPGNFLVTGVLSGALMAVDSAGRPVAQPVLPGLGDRGQIYRSLARTGDGGVLLVGSAGAFARTESGSWVREGEGIAQELQVVAAGPRSEYAVGARGQVLRRVDGQWTPLLPGSEAQIVDTFFDRQDRLWAVGVNGALLRRDELGWAQQGATPTAGVGLTQTSDGRLWAVGSHSITTYDAGLSSWGPVLFRTGAGTFEPLSSSYELLGLAGTEIGNTWIYGDQIVVRYEAAGWSISKLGWGRVRDLFVTDAGTAWAAEEAGTVKFFDGTGWNLQVPLAGAGPCTSVWGPSPDFVYVACSGGNFRVHRDGRSEAWDASAPASVLTGVLTSSGYLVIGGDGSAIWVADGTQDPTAINVGLDFAVTRLRTSGSRLYVIGDRDHPRGAVLSIELPQ